MRIPIVVLILLIISGCTRDNSGSSKSEQVDRLMEELQLSRTLSLYPSSYSDEARRLYENIPASFWESEEYLTLINDYKQNLWDGWRNAYMEYLTEEELSQLLSFIETPLGQKFIAMQKDLERVFAEVNAGAAAKLNDRFARLLNKLNP